MIENLAAVSSDQHPMVSGSETSSLNSLSFPSDMLSNALADMGNGADPDIRIFETFVLSEDFASMYPLNFGFCSVYLICIQCQQIALLIIFQLSFCVHVLIPKKNVDATFL